MIQSFFELLTQSGNYFEKIFGSQQSLLIIMPLALIAKLIIITILIIKSSKNPQKHFSKQLIFLIIAITGQIFSDLAWTSKTLYGILPFNYSILIFITRIAWCTNAIQYQALSLFLENLTTSIPKISLRQKIFSVVSCLLFLFFLTLSFLNLNCINSSQRLFIEFKVEFLATIFSLFIIIPSTFFFLFKQLRTSAMPSILKKQIKTLLNMLLIPWYLCDLLQVFPFNFSGQFAAGSYAMVAMATIFITTAIYFSINRIMGLRFLNLQKQVQSAQPMYTFNFIDNFKGVLEQMSFATTINELGHITQTYFKDCFDIPLRRTVLYARKHDTSLEQGGEVTDEHQCTDVHAKTHATIENFLSLIDKPMHTYLQQTKIIVHDEIAFNSFYENNEMEQQLIHLMEKINADIFLPVYDKQRLIAYIVIERYSRGRDQFYSNVEHDEMVVFANYLANVIHLLQSRNLENLIQQEKELKEELYNKHQEINQYKESIRSFLRSNSQKKIGIIFYKNRHFTFANQAAQELIHINPNAQMGHPITTALKSLVRQVSEYRTPQTQMINDFEGNKLVLSAIPNIEHSTIIITIHHPELSDILATQMDHLKDPSKWDYLLYLETTGSGQLINQLIPSNSETFLNFKIELLKTALSKKATLVDMPEEDIMATVELLHHISLREQLHVLNLTSPEKNFEIATKIFGINNLFAINPAEANDSLFKRLNNTGTLYIKNIQFLSTETQDYLAEFLRYGYYRIFKSEQKINATIRIICSSNQDLALLTDEKKFSHSLFNELKKTTLVMPSLLTMPESELNDLADAFTEQVLQEKTFKNFLDLTEKEKHTIMSKRPASLQEMRTKVQQQLVWKSKKQDVFEETRFNLASEITEPELMEAARLGKHALKDGRLLALLWNKFGNQTMIAAFLGVNRSSVNRRLKEYNLH